MKTISLVLVFLGMVLFNNTSMALTATGHTIVSDKYLSFGSGILLTPKSVLQSDVLVGFDSGAYVLLWSSTTFGRESSSTGVKPDGSFDYGKEFDIGTGWAGKVHGLDVDVGVTYFDEPRLANFGAEDVVYSHFKMGRTFSSGYALSFIFENYWSLPSSGLEGGSLVGLEVSKTFKLAQHISLTTMIGAVYDDGGFGANEGILIRGAATLSYQFSPNSSFDIGCRFYNPTMSDYREPDAVGWLGFTEKF